MGCDVYFIDPASSTVTSKKPGQNSPFRDAFQPKFPPVSYCNLDWFQSWTTKRDRRALADPLRLHSATLFSMNRAPSYGFT